MKNKQYIKSYYIHDSETTYNFIVNIFNDSNICDVGGMHVYCDDRFKKIHQLFPYSDMSLYIDSSLFTHWDSAIRWIYLDSSNVFLACYVTRKNINIPIHLQDDAISHMPLEHIAFNNYDNFYHKISLPSKGILIGPRVRHYIMDEVSMPD